MRALGSGFTLRHARIPRERAQEFHDRLMALALEFSRQPRSGEVEHAMFVGLYATTAPGRRHPEDPPCRRLTPRPPRPTRTHPVLAPSTAGVARRELPQGLRGERHLQPRRRRVHHRLPVARVGRHPQPGAGGAGRGRAAPAVARVHADRRRHHRSGRPARAMVADGRAARVGHRRRRRRRVRASSPTCPAPDRLDDVVHTQWLLYLAVVVATLLLGMAEVLRDNSAQTIIPSIVEPEHLERANGRMWSAEGVANTFVGPPLGCAPDRRVVRPAVRHRRRVVLRRRAPRVRRPRQRSEPHGPTTHVQQSWKAELREGVRLVVAPPAPAPDGDHPRR